MRKSFSLTMAVVLFLAVPAVLRAEDVNTDPVIQPGDSLVETDDPTIMGDSTADGGADAANVLNPDASANGKIQIKIDSDGYSEIYRSGALVERTELIDKEDGCKEALAQIGKVLVCGDTTTLNLNGRPEFKCPAGSNGVTEPCTVPVEAS